MAHAGRLKRFLADKGYGFIENSDGSGDVFLHSSQLIEGDPDDLVQGVEIAFDIEEDARSGRTRATNVAVKHSAGKGKGRPAWDWEEPAAAQNSLWERTEHMDHMELGRLLRKSGQQLMGQGKSISGAPVCSVLLAEQVLSRFSDLEAVCASVQSLVFPTRFETELADWLLGLDRGQGEMRQFKEAISWHYSSWSEFINGAIEDFDSQPFKLDEGFLWKIRLHETGHSILLATGLRKLVDQGLHEAKAGSDAATSQPDSGREAQPEAEDTDRDSGAEDEDCIRVFVCIMARGVELTLSLPVDSTIAQVMAKLEELEGVEHGAQHLFSSSQSSKLEPEELVVDGTQLFLSSLEDVRMLSLLPEHIRPQLNSACLVDVVLDLDRKPVVHERDDQGNLRKRVLDGCPLVTQGDLDAAEAHELLAGRWTKDNRSGISGTLHRVARIVDHYGGGSLTGLTLRMAHPMYGLTEKVPQLRRVIEDGKSLLVLGPPGSGKTTLLREVARSLSEEFNRRVFVIDTSSEICGFGRSAHVAVGRTTRRMQVADRSLQHKDMLEAVQNHTPEVLVIDEIGSQEEVEAACRIGFKGISLVATAHANNLKEAMDNVALQSLFGGFQTSTVADQTAQRSADGRKFVVQRRSAPVFRSLVELGRGSGDEWVVHEDLEGAVDLILARKPALGSRVPAPGAHSRTAGPGASRSLPGKDPTAQESAGAETPLARGHPATRAPEAAALGPDEIEARRSMRDREISGRAYRLCFDGGVDGGNAGPGGAGAILRRLRAGTGHPDRRTSRTWMLYHPRSCPELMEYAGLLIGLRGVEQILQTLRPAPEVILIEGDCKFVVDRHSGVGTARGLRSEHPDVEAKMDRLAQLVEEAVQQIAKKNVTVDMVKWRNRGRNKAADRLSHEARDWKRSTIELGPEVLGLLNSFETGPVPTAWHVKAQHPMLRISNCTVMHPQQSFGFVGMELTPDSADGSFSLSVRVDGGWSKLDSFLLGLVPSDTIDFTRAREGVAGEIGFWFSPKSGTVCGTLEGQKAQFILPSLAGMPCDRVGLGLAKDKKKAPLLPGTRWGMTYKRGGLELFLAMPGDALQSLGHVQWPWGDTLPERRYSAALLFKPRRGGSGSGVVGWGKGSGRRSHPPLCNGAPDGPPIISRDPCLTLLGQWHASDSCGWTWYALHPGLGFLEQLSEGEVRHIQSCRRCFEGHCSDLDAENFCRGLTDVELARRWIQSRRSFMVDTYLPIQSVSPGIRVSGRKIYHPQCRLKHEWVQFTATFSDCLAVGLGGQWSNNDSFLIGVTPAECNFDPAAHPADLGFFFAPRSVSMLGLDGTNFSWPSELQAAWERQMTEEGFDCEMNDFSRHGEGCCLATFQGAAWCIKRSKLNELEIYYLHDDEWAKVGVAPWKSSLLKTWKRWHFTIIFKSRQRHGVPWGGIHNRKGVGKSQRCNRQLPFLNVMLYEELVGEIVRPFPSTCVNEDGFTVMGWESGKTLVEPMQLQRPEVDEDGDEEWSREAMTRDNLSMRQGDGAGVRFDIHPKRRPLGRPPPEFSDL
ncbi:ycf45 [Symbiodinium natans]|uniref:Ycf45 protein n=1 Tax=Symbiodinium natans TaxID=878477 RepID=A0A812PXE4_9DINO|nr:ycf45 [Symbiodinium natans]